MNNRRLSRRALLKGLGTAIALPMLEAMLPRSLGVASSPSPRRMAFLYVPNGADMANWTPTATGGSFTLPAVLEPLGKVRDDVLILSGLTLDKARPHGDGAGDHARAMATFLTGCQARKTHGANIQVGISADQLAAQKIGSLTRFPSLELGCDHALNSGNCDSGYSCAYSANLSWRTPTTPNAKEINPRLVFERLFSNGVQSETAPAQARRERKRLSILDFVAEDARGLQAELGASDRRKLDEYLGSIRELEIRLNRAAAPAAEKTQSGLRPAGIPVNFQEYIRLMCDLMVFAFQGDLTRVATLVLAHDGSNRSYRFIGVPEGHHDLSHHGRNKEKLEKIKTINRFHVTQFAYLLKRLKSIRDGEGTLLDQSMIVYGSGIGDGDRHNHDDLPVLLGGKGGGSIKPGRHVVYKKETPLTNLYVSLLDKMGATVKAVGDSSGPLDSL